MKQYTQTRIGLKGNCFQTALACILEVEPDSLPAQDVWDVGRGLGWACSYRNILQGYLLKHHGMMYASFQDWEFAGIQVRDPGFHVMSGPSPRTSEAFNVHHAVVGCYGATVWDPHPSRVGLTEVTEWGVLAPIIPRIRADRERYEPGSQGRRVFVDCLCSACAAARGDDLSDLLKPLVVDQEVEPSGAVGDRDLVGAEPVADSEG
jgi:hypothetical protein